jgi:hypothetical protein
MFLTLSFFAYFISLGIALLDDMGLLTLFPLLVCASAIFGILGGSVLFSSCFKKFSEVKRRGSLVT